MIAETLEHHMQLDVLCKQVSSVDEQVELVAILNPKGRVVEMTARDDGVNKDLTGQKREMLFMESVLQASMNREYDDEFGKVKGSILQREKVSAFSFQIDRHLLLAITKSVSDPTRLQQKIAELIYSYTKTEC